MWFKYCLDVFSSQRVHTLDRCSQPTCITITIIDASTYSGALFCLDVNITHPSTPPPLCGRRSSSSGFRRFSPAVLVAPRSRWLIDLYESALILAQDQACTPHSTTPLKPARECLFEMPTFTTGAGLTGGTVLFPHERWMAGKMHLEVECYFRTSKLRGSVSITIRSDSTILSLKRCLLNSIEITHMECFPGNEVDMPFVMEDFKPLTFVLVADRNKELLYWRAEEDNVRIIQHEDFIASLQETYVRANVGKKKVKMHRKCLERRSCKELQPAIEHVLG